MKLRVTRSIAPNMLTLGNLFSGFSAIIYAAQGDFHRAAFFIFLAAIFDVMDGVVARLVRATSELGAELDSLCDGVSFGVAPAFLLYKAFFFSYGEIGIFVASLPAMAGVLRLARFNVQLTSFEDKLYFNGLPIPAGALTLVSYLVYYHNTGLIPPEYLPGFMFGLSIAVALAMVSTIKYDNIPRPTAKSFKARPTVSIIFYIGVILCAVTKGKAIFPFMAFYIVAGAIRYSIQLYRANRSAIDDIDESYSDED